MNTTPPTEPRRGAWLDGDVIHVRGGGSGAWFRADIAVDAVASVELEPLAAARRGVRGYRGHWLVDVVGRSASPWGLAPVLGPQQPSIGAGSPSVAGNARLIRLVFQRTVAGKVFVFPVAIRSLRVGVDDAEAFVVGVARRKGAVEGPAHSRRDGDS